MPRTSKETGGLLESAVRAIESAILRSSPSYLEGTFGIEGNKIVVIAGVRHEIDIYVKVALAPGYDPVFIFECKNWQQRVGKNEIIVFSEKIRALSAQRGFFVARAFTRDARAQAKLDPRIELLTAAQLNPATVLVPLHFHELHVGQTNASVEIHGERDCLQEQRAKIDLTTTRLTIGASEIDASALVQSMIAEARDRRVGMFDSATAQGGRYEVAFSAEREFAPGDATFEGNPLRCIAIEGTVELFVNRAKVVSAFDVPTRGRSITVHVNSQIGEITAQFIQLTLPP